MQNDDTVELLRECDAGTKMAVASIDEVTERVEDPALGKLLSASRREHEKLGDELHALLLKRESDDKEPAAMAKGMSWIKTNLKLGVNGSDATVADLVTDGCNMGIKSLCRYLNKYRAADSTAKRICTELIRIEEKLVVELRRYL